MQLPFLATAAEFPDIHLLKCLDLGIFGNLYVVQFSDAIIDFFADTDGDEPMDEEYQEQEETTATSDKSINDDQSDISESEGEEEDVLQEQDLDDSLQEGCGSNSRASKFPLACGKHQKRGGDGARHQRQCRKRKRRDQDFSTGDQFAAEVKRLKESKLKHNKNEQLRQVLSPW